jgi:hypothetical protein
MCSCENSEGGKGEHAPEHTCVSGCVVVSRVIVQTDKVRACACACMYGCACARVCVCVCLSQVYGAQNGQWA